jgi:uncharacterized membrane protein YphA (DoxX/SURF4 family)
MNSPGTQVSENVSVETEMNRFRFTSRRVIMQTQMKQTRIFPRRLPTGLSWFIALELFLFAPFKFYPRGILGYPSYPEKFVHWGYPAWFSFVVGGGELLAAMMLVIPRRRFLGAVLLMFILTGAVATHIINHDSLADSVSAPVHLVLAGVVALACWPADWREPLALSRRGPGSERSASQHS